MALHLNLCYTINVRFSSKNFLYSRRTFRFSSDSFVVPSGFFLYTFKEIEVILNFKVTKIVKVDFPMKGFDEFKGICFKIVGVKGEEFYLFEEFDIEKNIDILYFK